MCLHWKLSGIIYRVPRILNIPKRVELNRGIYNTLDLVLCVPLEYIFWNALRIDTKDGRKTEYWTKSADGILDS